MSHEIPLMRTFLVEYQRPNVRLFRRQIIDRTVKDVHTNRIFQVKAGVVGQADIYGFVKKDIPGEWVSCGADLWPREAQIRTIPVEIECKGARTRVSDEQKAWRAFCLSWGIPHLELRAQADETEAMTVTRWCVELDSLVQRL